MNDLEIFSILLHFYLVNSTNASRVALCSYSTVKSLKFDFQSDPFSSLIDDVHDNSALYNHFRFQSLFLQFFLCSLPYLSEKEEVF